MPKYLSPEIRQLLNEISEYRQKIKKLKEKISSLKLSNSSTIETIKEKPRASDGLILRFD